MYAHEQLLVERYRERPFALIGVNSDKDRAAVRATMVELDLPWRTFWDGGSTHGPIATAWNVDVWPTIYLIDHRGILRFKDLRGDALDAALAQLVAEAEAEGE